MIRKGVTQKGAKHCTYLLQCYTPTLPVLIHVHVLHCCGLRSFYLERGLLIIVSGFGCQVMFAAGSKPRKEAGSRGVCSAAGGGRGKVEEIAEAEGFRASNGCIIGSNLTCWCPDVFCSRRNGL